jgi:Ca2+-binding RTX toxin-like protein
MLPSADTNLYTALVTSYVLNFMNFERLQAGSADDQFIIENALQRFNLYGGVGNDSFTFLPGASLADLAASSPLHPGFTSSIDGQGGIDTLDYSLYNAPALVNLGASAYSYAGSTYQPQSAMNVGGGLPGRLVNLENINGSSQNDVLIGDNGDNTITGNGSDDYMAGGLGNDTYIFTNGWGNDMVVEQPGQGRDTLDFSGVTVPLSFVFNGASDSVADALSADSLTTNNNVENFTGGSDSDTFLLPEWGADRRDGGRPRRHGHARLLELWQRPQPPADRAGQPGRFCRAGYLRRACPGWI